MNKKIKLFFYKAGHWEFWNTNIVYLPLLPYLLYLMIKSRDLFFFKNANPGIEHGGFILDSKWNIQENFGHYYFPKSFFIPVKDRNALIIFNKTKPLDFPIIAKPDIGAKGSGVAIINNIEELEKYHKNCTLDYLLQEKIELTLEIGLFYVKIPGEQKGRISGIVFKENISVIGNGFSTVFELLSENKRYALQLNLLKNIIAESVLKAILPSGTTKLILDIGNHSRGSLFLDYSSKISTQLTDTFDSICSSFPNFYFGRLDIKFDNWDDLELGKQFKIIEVNGSGSEPTHIYDPSHSIFFAWKEIKKHWRIMMEISILNSKKGYKKLKLKEAYTHFKSYKNHQNKLKQIKF